MLSSYSRRRATTVTDDWETMKKKVIPIRQPILPYDFKETVKKFNQFSKTENDQYKIYSELGFSYIEQDDHSSLCPNCLRNGSCPVHPVAEKAHMRGANNRKRVRVDFTGFAQALEDRSNGVENHYFLNIETGEVILISDWVLSAVSRQNQERLAELPEWQRYEVDLAKKALGDEKRFIAIDSLSSSEFFNFMIDFKNAVHNIKIRKMLEIALRGKGASRRFKDILGPANLERWYKFKDEKLWEFTEDWLSGVPVESVELYIARE